MKIFFISDIHGELSSISEAAKLIEDSDLVVISGDLTHKGTGEEAGSVINAIEKFNTRILAVHGNWDGPDVNDYLKEKNYSLHASGRIIDGIGFFGLGGSSPTPFKTRTEYSEEEILQFLETGFNNVKSAARRILVSHVPPRGHRDRSFIGLHGGSKSVKEFIENTPVDLCLCGHIHEASGIEQFNSTIIANPGSFKKGKYISIEINETIELSQGNIR